MLIEESIWITNSIFKNKLDNISPVLNLGSSSLDFRQRIQPFINENIFMPLNLKGVKVVHTDIQNDVGVDLVGDLSDKAFVDILKQNHFKTVICSNLLEHLIDETRVVICKTIDEILMKESLAIITVPRIYPYHEDPIDTWYRPSVNELMMLFPNFKLIEGSYVKGQDSFFSELKKRPLNMFLSIIKLFIPFYKFSEWKNDIKYLPKWFRRYEVTCIIIMKK